MAIDWNAPLQTKDGKFGMLMPAIPFETRRRVAVARNGHRPSSDRNQWSQPGKEVTVWLYPESGVARCDGQPSDLDLENAR